MGHGKFAVLTVADRRQLRYRRILTKPKINNNTATAKVVAVVLQLCVTAAKHPCLAPVGHGKFAVLMASNMLDLRYRRILTKLKINNNTATAFAVAVVLHQKTAVKLHSGFYSYLLFINRAFKP